MTRPGWGKAGRSKLSKSLTHKLMTLMDKKEENDAKNVIGYINNLVKEQKDSKTNILRAESITTGRPIRRVIEHRSLFIPILYALL